MVRSASKAKRYFLMLGLTALISSCQGQKPYGGAYLSLLRSIPMPGIRGRIDHMAVNLKDSLVYISALGNNTVEVVDLRKGRLIHSIPGMKEPQGIAYLPGLHELFVAQGQNGSCYFLNGRTFQRIATLRFSSDADNVRFDQATGRIYLAYGSGGIGVIDDSTHRILDRYPLPGHPESFQFEGNRILANIPDAGILAVLDRKTGRILARWVPPGRDNFPMAIDSVHHRLFVGTWHPERLLVWNSESGRLIHSYPITGDADDIYFDESLGLLFISGGSGYINLFYQIGPDTYKQIANIPTRPGSRTSLLVPSWNLFLVAEPQGSGTSAALCLYRYRK